MTKKPNKLTTKKQRLLQCERNRCGRCKKGFAKTNGLNKFGFPEVYVGPERFEKFREACRINFHLLSCHMDSVVPSYDEKAKVND